MKNTQQGFIGLLVLIVVGAAIALHYTKDEKGVSYLDKMMKTKEETMKAVDTYKDIMNKRDKDIEKNLK
jgi:hypothetical protein